MHLLSYVIAAYAVTAAVLLWLVASTLFKARQTRRQLGAGEDGPAR